MSAAQALTYHDGKLDVPQELQREWNLSDGDSLEVLSSTGSTIVLAQTSLAKAIDATKAWDNFISLRGLFAEEDGDPNASLEEERLREIRQDSH